MKTGTNAGISTSDATEIDLLAQWNVLWRYKYLIATVSFVCGLIVAGFSLLMTPIFKSQVVVTYAQQEAGGGLSGLSSQLGGLATLAGVNLGGGASMEREARAVLKSRYLVEQFVQSNNLLPVLSSGDDKPQTLWFGVRRFQNEVLGIREDPRQGFVVVSMDWTDGATAARWANEIIRLANDLMRTRAIEESKKNIEYLSGQVAKTDDVELRHALYSVLAAETKTLTIATGRSDYAFRIVDPAVAPEIRSRPQRTLLVFFGLIAGAFGGAIFALIRNAMTTQKRESEVAR